MYNEDPYKKQVYYYFQIWAEIKRFLPKLHQNVMHSDVSQWEETKKTCIYIFDFGLTKRDSTGIYKTSFVNNSLVHIIRYSGLVSFFN